MPDSYIDVMDVGEQIFFCDNNYFLPSGIHEITSPTTGTLRYKVATFLSGCSWVNGEKLYFSKGIPVRPVEGAPLTLFEPLLSYQERLNGQNSVEERAPVPSNQLRLFE